MRPESVVCWLWKPAAGYRSQFTTEHVNVLASMVRRHFRHPHRFICVTDIPKGLDAGIEALPDFGDFATVPSPYGQHQPSCYRRLRAFHPAIGRAFGTRFVSLDLDTVIVGDLTPLWDRPEDFVAWGETDPRSYYNGSMFMLTAGARPQVWTQFDPKVTPAAARAAGKFGSDQGTMSYLLGPGEARWTTADGVYSYNVHLREKRSGTVKPLPSNARIVMFHGARDPWGPEGQQLSWVREHWRRDAPVALSA